MMTDEMNSNNDYITESYNDRPGDNSYYINFADDNNSVHGGGNVNVMASSSSNRHVTNKHHYYQQQQQDNTSGGMQSVTNSQPHFYLEN